MLKMKSKLAVALSLSMLALTAGNLSRASEVDCATVASDTAIRTYPINPLTGKQVILSLGSDGSVEIYSKGTDLRYYPNEKKATSYGASGFANALKATGDAIEMGIEAVEQFYSTSPVEKLDTTVRETAYSCDGNDLESARGCAKIMSKTLAALEWTYWNMDRFHDKAGVQAIYCAKERLKPALAKMKAHKKELKAKQLSNYFNDIAPALKAVESLD
ncbi:MAG: hypothetical protein H7222_02215 [Methylotenera sp.]|nr:hypothetical protein [Oligoflexia bacterium]